jgi:hypothetical protein
MHTRRPIASNRLSPTGAMLLCLLPCLAGCNPNLDVDGALIPAWVIAGVLGIAATIGSHAALVRLGIDRHLVARPAVYLSLGITFICVVWIAVFRY